MAQLSFSRLWGSSHLGVMGCSDEQATENWTPFPTDEAARMYRDELYLALKKAGYKVNRFTLRGQVRQYWSMGVPCGDSCTVYYIQFVNS